MQPTQDVMELSDLETTLILSNEQLKVFGNLKHAKGQMKITPLLDRPGFFSVTLNKNNNSDMKNSRLPEVKKYNMRERLRAKLEEKRAALDPYIKVTAKTELKKQQ